MDDVCGFHQYLTRPFLKPLQLGLGLHVTAMKCTNLWLWLALFLHFSGKFHVVQHNSFSDEVPEVAIYPTVRYIWGLVWRQQGACTPMVGPKWNVTSLRVLTSFLLCCGDIQPNPGPIKYPCQVCDKAVRSNQHGIECSNCEKWCHRVCRTVMTPGSVASV